MERAFAILVLIDIVDSTKFTERVGDKHAAETMRVYNRIFRGLLIKYDGLEIDKTDGALLLFESMKNALNYVFEYHRIVERRLGLKSRVGIHCGHIMMHSNSKIFVSRGAKPIEVDGLQKAVAARIMSLAKGGQTFMSKRAGEYASSVKGGLLMKDLGVWRLKGVQAPMTLYAIGKTEYSLAKPKENDKVKLVKPPKMNAKEILQLRFYRYIATPIAILGLYILISMLAFMEYTNQIDGYIFRGIYGAIDALITIIVSWSSWVRETLQ